MKIGIITFNSAHNYGAVLQAWAFQEYLKALGHEVEIINFRIKAIDSLYALFKPRNVFKNESLNKIVWKIQYLKKRKNEPNKARKYYMFEKFINNDLNTTKVYKTFKELKEANLDYDILIAGSDQIWNGNFTRGINPAYFLAFGSPNAKRITYAASIGRDCLEEEEKFLFEHYLKNIDYISVREENAKNQISGLTDKPVSVVLDPTLLLDSDKYKKLKKSTGIKTKYIYVHNVHLKRIDERLNRVVEEMSKRLNLPVIQNHDDYDYSNELKKFSNGSPSEFLGYIADAEYVITNSFHATVFSIIFNRNFITVPHFKNPDRMKHLLGSLGIENHLIEDSNLIPDNLNDLNINYENVQKLHEELKKDSIKFLNDALNGEKTVDGKKILGTYLHSKDRSLCCGCNVCEEICPHKAITMKIDNEGFMYPYIDTNLCTSCGLCEKQCIYNNNIEFTEDFHGKVFLAANTNKEMRMISSEAGIIEEMFKKTIEENGVVIGQKFTSDYKCKYEVITNKGSLDLIKGDILIQADSKGIKDTIKKYIEEGKKVLFSATPCEIEALKIFLGKKYDNLITITTNCLGAGSPKLFNKYLDGLEIKYKSSIIKYDFKNKFRGWENNYTIAEFNSGELYLESTEKDAYNKAYINGFVQRPSCYSCNFVKEANKIADVTLGMITNKEKLDADILTEEGLAFVCINTSKGNMLWNKVQDKYNIKEICYENLGQFVRNNDICLLLERDKIFNNMNILESEQFIKSLNFLLSCYEKID